MTRGSLRIAQRTMTDLSLPGEPRDVFSALFESARTSLDTNAAAGFTQASYEIDITKLLPHVQAPTLVLHRQGDLVVNWQLGRELSTTIPNSRFTALPGRVHWTWLGDVDRILDVLFDFLAPGTPVPARETDPSAAVAPQPPRKNRSPPPPPTTNYAPSSSPMSKPPPSSPTASATSKRATSSVVTSNSPARP